MQVAAETVAIREIICAGTENMSTTGSVRRVDAGAVVVVVVIVEKETVQWGSIRYKTGKGGEGEDGVRLDE